MKLLFEEVHLTYPTLNLHLDVELQGEMVAFFGPSGSGKTTLLELIAGLRKPCRGKIGLDGKVLTDSTNRVWVPPDCRGVGYVPQEGALFPHLSVHSNLCYGSKRKGTSSLFSLEHVCDVLNLAPLMGLHPRTLSGGEKQRVALGRALLSQPHLLLLDEPLASLDDQLKMRTLELLKRVREEFRLPMIYVSHSIQEVMALCDQVLVLDRKVSTGVPSEIFSTL